MRTRSALMTVPTLLPAAARRKRLACAVIAALLATSGATAVSTPATAQETDTDTAAVRIVARKLESGRIEFGLQQRRADDTWDNRQLPSRRFFPTTATVNRWLASSPLDLPFGDVRIVARKLESGRIEFGLQQRRADDTWDNRQLPSRRFFPTTATVNRWLASSPLTLTAPRTADGRYPAVTVGSRVGCVLRSVDTITCWGYNDPRYTAPAPAGTFTAVAAGGIHVCALRTDNTIACWEDYRGVDMEFDFLLADEQERFSAVSAGGWQMCALRTDNTIVCADTFGGGEIEAPAGQFTALSAGGDQVCGLRTDNTIVCVDSSSGDEIEAPAGQFTAVSSGGVFAGGDHSCALRTDNTIVCWGDNDAGQSDSPAGQFTAVSAGGDHSCALRTDNTITCWGKGYGTSNQPAGRYTSVSAGGSSPASCAVRTSGEVTCWGVSHGYG